ncbi:hypothetical protein [Rubripirellula reticaptiva]|nr:hypothetical protein [Rubripirellula reticaptiva]
MILPPEIRDLNLCLSKTILRSQMTAHLDMPNVKIGTDHEASSPE